jgi:hypothetical protein
MASETDKYKQYDIIILARICTWGPELLAQHIPGGPPGLLDQDQRNAQVKLSSASLCDGPSGIQLNLLEGGPPANARSRTIVQLYKPQHLPKEPR